MSGTFVQAMSAPPVVRSVDECRAAIARIMARQLPDKEAEIWDAMRPAERSVWVRMCGAADWVENGRHLWPWSDQPEDLRIALLEKFRKWSERAGVIQAAIAQRAAS